MNMGKDQNNAVEQGEKLMKRHRIDEAIIVFEEHLAQEPDDMKAQLRLGICHLLNRNRDRFLAIYEHAKKALKNLAGLPADLARLWKHYQKLAVGIGAAALVISATAAASEKRSAHKYSGGVYKPRPTEIAKPEAAKLANPFQGQLDAIKRVEERLAKATEKQKPDLKKQLKDAKAGLDVFLSMFLSPRQKQVTGLKKNLEKATSDVRKKSIQKQIAAAEKEITVIKQWGKGETPEDTETAAKILNDMKPRPSAHRYSAGVYKKKR